MFSCEGTLNETDNVLISYKKSNGSKPLVLTTWCNDIAKQMKACSVANFGIGGEIVIDKIL